MKKGIYLLIGMVLFLMPATYANSNVKSFASPPRPDTIPTQYTRNDKIYAFSKIWSEIKYNFVNIDRLDFDMDSLYVTMLPEVLNTRNDLEYFEVLDKFMAKMNDGHTQIVGTTYAWNDYYDYTPALIEEFDGKYYITSITEQSDIDKSLLYAEVVEVYGVPPLQYVIENYFPMVSASTYQSRLMQAGMMLMQGRIGSTLDGKARKVNGDVVDFSIVRNGETTRTDDDTYIGVERSQPDGIMNLEWSDDIAILKVNSFRPKDMPKYIDEHAAEINKKAKGLIIDLRYNGGGTTPNARHLQMYLTKADSIASFGAQMKINNSYYRSQGNYRDEYSDHYKGTAYDTTPSRRIKVDENIRPFKMPVVILMGRYSFSACEDLLINLYESPDRPLLMGEPTGGSTGAPLMIPLPHDSMARVCSVRMTFPYSGKLFVGEGIQPDIVVKETFDDYINNVDAVKNKAIEYLDTLIHKK